MLTKKSLCLRRHVSDGNAPKGRATCRVTAVMPVYQEWRSRRQRAALPPAGRDREATRAHAVLRPRGGDGGGSRLIGGDVVHVPYPATENDWPRGKG